MTQTGPTRDKGEQFSRGPVRQPPIEPGRAEQARRIAMLAPPWIPLPPPGYGGIEEVVALRTEALFDRGNDVELFCAPGSSSNAKLRPLLPTSHPESIERALFEADHVGRAFGAFDAAAADDNPFDVVHDHSGYTPLAMTDRIGQPLVHTVHGPFDERHDSVLRPPRREGQRRLHQPLTGELRSGRGEPARRRLQPDRHRNVAGGLREAGLPVLGREVRARKRSSSCDRRCEAGAPPPDPRRRGAVAPGALLRQRDPAAHRRRPDSVRRRSRRRPEAEPLRGAWAFLMPITWPEPFGMVMVEALAAGTPVLAFPNGAAPEIVEHGNNGFLVDDEDEMAATVDRVREIEPAECRRSAQRFSPDRVAAGYEAAYRDAIERHAEARRVCGIVTSRHRRR